MSKKLAYLILFITGIVVALGSFVVSPLAPPLMKWGANNYIEGLTIEQTSGSLMGDLSLSGLRFSQAGLDVNIDTTTLNLDWACTDVENLCIESLIVNGPTVAVTQTGETKTQSSNTDDSLSLPLQIVIDEILVTNINLVSSPFRISIEELSTALSMENAAEVPRLNIRGIEIDDATPPAPAKPFTGIQYQAPSLPVVKVPLPVSIENLAVNQITYKTSDATQRIALISSHSVSAKEDTVSWQSLNVSHAQGEVSTTGRISLSDNYNIDATFSARADVADNQQQTADVQLQGSLAELDFTIQLTGLVDGKATLNMNVLSDTLPIAGNLSWPSQPVGYQSIESLEAGELTVGGEIHNYSMQLNTGLTERALGKTELAVDFVLTDTSFLINQLDATLLGGDITTRGKVNFIDGLSGTGFTRARGLTLTSLLRGDSAPQQWQALTLQQAEWQYVLQQRPNGIEVLLADINADIQQAFNKAKLVGQAAYSQGNDLGVATLTLSQNGQNIIGMTAQVLNQRFINAKLNVAVKDISTFVSDVSGNIQGDISIGGEWQNPAFDASVVAQQIRIPESLSAELARQGELEASLSVEGNAVEHLLNLSLSATDASLQAELSGGYQANEWQGQISDAQLAVKQTLWDLTQPASIGIQTNSGQAALGDHCWQLAKDPATVCINQTLISATEGVFGFTLSELPVGAWAKPYITNLSSVTDSARLQLSGSGQFDQTGHIQATATASINPSTWTFAETNPVVLTLETLQSELTLNGDILNATLDFKSPELGEASAKVRTSISNPNDDENAVELFLANITLDPINDLSPSIHQLTGNINGELVLNGGVRKPSILGAFTLSNGNIEVEQSPLQLTNWQQTLTFKGMSAEIAGTMNIGEGNGEISGLIDWSDTPIVNLGIEAQDIALTHEQSRLTLSPNLNATILPDSVMVSGQIDVPYARIKIDSLPPSAVSPSKDVHLRGEPPETDPIKAINADVMITLDNNRDGEVKVDAFGLTADLHGGLQIINQPSVVGYGDLQILNGRYQAYGQNLLIRAGEVQFNGPLSQPFLFVEAVRDPQLTEDGVIAGVRIDGLADAPTVELFSEPAMDQNQNLLYLLSGSGNLNASSSEDDTAFQTALLGFGLASSGAFTSGVGDALGIEDLSLTTVGQGDSTQVAVSGRIAKNLTLRYGVGVFDNETEIALRYQIIPKLYIEAVRGISLAVDMYYEFAVGELEPEPVPQEAPSN